MRILLVLISIFSFNVSASTQDLCSSALMRLGDCLALQSDFNDAIQLKSQYSSGSSCIQGVDFYSGIALEDADSLRSTYKVGYESKGDPLSRPKETTLSKTTQYCSGDIQLLVKEQMKKVSIVFHVAAGGSDQTPEISIDF